VIRDRRRNLRGDRGFGKRLGVWCLGTLALLLLMATNLYFRSGGASAEDVSLDALRAAYAHMQPGETAAPDLAGLGFDTANGGVRRLIYLWLMEYFAPRDSSGFDQMDPAAQKCLNTPDDCSAFIIRLARATGSEQHATFGFVNGVEASGPRAEVEVVFLIHDGRIAYKAMTGN
jgi:hypothetical protein